MKIGLLTFHSAHNYGAVLQAYALQQQLIKLGHSVEIIDYRPRYITDSYDRDISFFRSYTSKLKKTLSIIKMLVWYVFDRCLHHKKYIYKKRTRAIFSDFITSKLKLSSNTYYDTFISNYDYDVYIIGSDQIWNIDITQGIDKIFWGDFIVTANAKKMTYAASMSNYSLSSSEISTISSCLQKFSAISVRETELQSFLLKTININSDLVLDPTLLVDPLVFRNISQNPISDIDYILVYSLGMYDEEVRIAKSISTELSKPLVIIEGESKLMTYRDSVRPVSPEEFLGLFQNAFFVVTASFHGTVFSIINNKPFYSIGRGNDKDSRIITLLSQLQISNRLLYKGADVRFMDLDYTESNKRLLQIRKNALNFLVKNLAE